MDLDKYFEQTGIKKIHFLKITGLSSKTLHDISKGVDIRLSTAFKIYKHTDKKVTPFDLYEMLEKNKEKNDGKGEKKNKDKVDMYK